MAQTFIDFSNFVVDGIAGGGLDNRIQVGDFVFTIQAEGNWFASISEGRFNFQEAPGTSAFTITITTASGATLDFYDYQVSVNGSPELIGGFAATTFIDGTSWGDENFNGSGLGGGYYYRATFNGQVPPVALGNSLTITDQYQPGGLTCQMTVWMDNITFETGPAPALTPPSLTATSQNPTMTEGGASVDLFGSVTANTRDGQQTFASLTLTVTNVAAGDTMTIDGKTISVAAGQSGSLTSNGSYAVMMSGATATITLSGLSRSNGQMNTLIDDMRYGTTGDNPGSASHAVTITQIRDSGVSNNSFAPNITTTVLVLPINDAPSGSDKTIAMLEDGTHTFAAADFGFFDVDSNSLSGVKITTLPAAGSLILDSSVVQLGQIIAAGDISKLTWTPAPNANGTSLGSFTFQVIDNGGTANGGVDIDPSPNTIKFDVASVNDAPTGLTTGTLPGGTEDTDVAVDAADLLAGFVDADGDALSISAISADHGTVSLNGGVYTIKPTANYNGPLVISYTVTDGHGGTIDATRTVDLAAANDTPTGSATGTLPGGTEDTDVAVDAATLLAGFVDADGDALSISAISADHGTVSLNGGVYTITPTANYNGPLVISYTVTDGHGGTINATRTVDLAAVNDAAVITGTNSAAIIESDKAEAVSGSLSATDVDSSSAFVVQTDVAGAYGKFSIGTDGTWTYVMDGAHNELTPADVKTESFKVATADGTSETVTVTITGTNEPVVNHAPVLTTANDDASVQAGATVTLTIGDGHFSDSDGQDLDYTITVDGGAMPSWMTFDAETGAFTGQPTSGEVGAHTIVVTATDGSLSTTDTFNLIVTNAANPNGQFSLSNDTVAENSKKGTLVGELSGNDVDGDPFVSYALGLNPDKAFKIVDDELVVRKNAHLDFETKSEYDITIVATDQDGGKVEESFTINLTDVEESPKGTKHNDKLFGDALDNILKGKAGNDKLTGNDGADTFVFDTKHGHDVIKDFDPTEGDVIDLSRAKGIVDFDDLMANHVTDTGNHVKITAEDGSSLLIKHFEPSDLTADMFVF